MGDKSYTLKISIREQASATGKDRPYARPERLWELGDRNVIEVVCAPTVVRCFLKSGGIVLLHDGGIGDWGYVASIEPVGRIGSVDGVGRTRQNK